MTDYKEEQSNEIEALESIYPDELTILDTEPFYVFELSVRGEYDNNYDLHEEASCTVEFRYTETYPDTMPIMEVRDFDNLDDQQITQLTELMTETAEENVGMVSVFTVISAMQERMNEMMEIQAKFRQEEAERKIREAEEAEQKRFEGTQVTIETFFVWKAKFDAEIAEKKRLRGEKEKNDNKLTGKELFLTGKTQDDSDVQFLEDGDESVEVDESLFQDLDDLDLDEDLDLGDES